MGLLSGTRLGPYEIVAEIGAGGMGEVYRARDTRLGRDVAVKVLAEEFEKDSERLQRFEREARAAAALSHPNVIVVYDVGVQDSVSFVVTELLEGETLRARVARKPLGLNEAVSVASQVASGLSAAHARGIVHRDLKPENIFITHDGPAKILDFGVAKFDTVSASDELPTFSTVAGKILGSMGYMSPEQVRGLYADARSDIFSFGAILYEMVSGQRAFHGMSDADTLCAILERNPPPANVPSALLHIVNRCLEKDPSRRFQSAAELRSALRPAVDADGQAAGESRQKSIAVLPFRNMSADPDQEYFSAGLAEELINALTRLSGLRVASGTSAFRFRSGDQDVREIGRQLNVETVLEGSVRRAGNRLRVTAQLISVADGYHLWSERYDGEFANVFAIQDEITESIVKRLEPKSVGQAQEAPRRHSENLEAFELYLKGRHFWHQRTETSLRAGIQCFQQAIALDPTYALAHAGLADSYCILRPYLYVTAAEVRGPAEAAAKRAIELDPTLAESHFAMGLVVFWMTDDWPDAGRHFRKAVEIHPRSSMILAYYGSFLAWRHQFAEAESFSIKAIEVEPLSPFAHAHGALAFCAARKYQKAIELSERALELSSDFILGLCAIGLASCALGDYARSIKAYERVLTITNRTPIVLGLLGFAYGRAGHSTDARRLLDELAERQSRQHIDPIAPLFIHAGLGDRDKVYECMDLASRDHSAFPTIETWLDQVLDEYAVEPRFQDMFRRLRLVPRA